VKKEIINLRIKEVENKIKPYMKELSELEEELERLNYNDFRSHIQVIIEKLQKDIPHLGKFYFDDEYDSYDDHTLYYIYYENEASRLDKAEINRTTHKLFLEYFKEYTLIVDREPYEVSLNKLGLNI